MPDNNQSDKIASLLSMLDAEEEITEKNRQSEPQGYESYEDNTDDFDIDDYEDYEEEKPAPVKEQVIMKTPGPASITSQGTPVANAVVGNNRSDEDYDEDDYTEDEYSNDSLSNTSAPAGQKVQVNQPAAAQNVQQSNAVNNKQSVQAADNSQLKPSIADNIMNGIKGNGGLGGIAGKIGNINLKRPDNTVGEQNTLSANEMDNVINDSSSQYAGNGLSSNPVFDVFTSKQKKLDKMEEDRVMSQAYNPNSDGYYDDRLPKLVDEVMAASIGSVILKIGLAVICVAAVIVYCIYFVGI